MSGGYFDYVQYEIDDTADNIAAYIRRCEGTDNKDTTNYHYNYRPEYKQETIEKFKECENTLRRAAAMLQRVDWLASGDDSEESFHHRWENENTLKESIK